MLLNFNMDELRLLENSLYIALKEYEFLAEDNDIDMERYRKCKKLIVKISNEIYYYEED